MKSNYDALSGGVNAWGHGKMGARGGFGSGGALGGVSYSPQAKTIFAAMTTPPTSARKNLINATVNSLIAAGIWSKLDTLWVMAAADAQAACLNWINPATFTLTPTNAPIFVPGTGYKGNGTTSYLDTGFNFATNGVNYLGNSASIFVWSLESLRKDANIIGVASGTAVANIAPWDGSINKSSIAINDAGANPVAPFSGVGLFVGNRTANNALTLDQNGVNLASISTASTSVPNATARILGVGGTPQFVSNLTAIGGFGGALTPTQRTQLYTILKSYIDGASATINAYNNTGGFNSNGADLNAVISHHDDLGNTVDAHAGSFLQVGTKLYMYGETHRDGYAPGTAGTSPAGVAIYSNNLDNWGAWHFEGFAFDITQAPWPSRVTTQNGNFVGMYSPKVVYNALNNNYVLWFFNQQSASVAVVYTFTSSSPTFGATPTVPGNPTLVGAATFPVANIGTPSFYVEQNGINGWCVYNDLSNAYAVNVIALNAAFTDLSGSPTNTGMAGEGNGIFQRGGKTYVVTGATANAYASGNSYYSVAASPLGVYGAQIQINDAANPTSCQGQTRDVTEITLNGITSHVVWLDQWWRQTGTGGRANQGFANFYGAPLLFDASGNIQTFHANPANILPGAKLGTVTTPTVNPDQVSYGDVFYDYCDITATNWRMQTFIPTRSTLTTFELPLGRNNVSGQTGVANFVFPDGSLIAELVSLDGSKNPVSVLGTVTIPAANLKFATQWTVLSFGVAVTPGTEYGVRFHGTNTVGAFGLALSKPGGIQPYANGVERASGNSGSTWATESTISLMFSTT